MSGFVRCSLLRLSEAESVNERGFYAGVPLCKPVTGQSVLGRYLDLVVGFIGPRQRSGWVTAVS